MRYAMMLIALFCACASSAYAQQLTKSGDSVLIGQASGAVREIARDFDGKLLNRERLVMLPDGPVRSLDFVGGRYEFHIAVLGSDQFLLINGVGQQMTSKASASSNGAKAVLALNSAQYQVSHQGYMVDGLSLIETESIPLPEGREVRAFAWIYPSAVMALDTQGVVWRIPLMDIQTTDDDATTSYSWGMPQVFTAEFSNAVGIACDSDRERGHVYLLLSGKKGGLVCLDGEARWVAEVSFSVNEHRAALDVSIDGTIYAVESGNLIDTVWHYEVPTVEEGFATPHRFATARHITALQAISSARILH